jgi:hypothetical protein
MSIIRIPLDEQQEAHLALILDLSKVELGHVLKLKQEAEQRQADRLAPLTKSLGIPDGAQVNVERGEHGPCFLVYEQKEVERSLKLSPPEEAPVADSLSQESVKSTALTGEGR